MTYEEYTAAIKLIDQRHSKDVQEVQGRFAYSNAVAKIGDSVKTETGEEFVITHVRVTLDPVHAVPVTVYSDIHAGCFAVNAITHVNGEAVK